MTTASNSKPRVLYSLFSGAYFKSLGIGPKLVFAFGVLVMLTLLVIGVSYLAAQAASNSIERTKTVRAPTALAASSARSNLLRMLASMRGYLALGDPEFRVSYVEETLAFEHDLANLKGRLSQFDPKDPDRQRLDNLTRVYAEWKEFGDSKTPLPAQLFDLRDDQLLREPAYNTLATDGIKFGASVLISTRDLIKLQAAREGNEQNTAMLQDMAEFQGSFAAILSGLRGYVTTRNRTFRSEYEANFDLNRLAWQTLADKRAQMTPDQQTKLDEIKQNRDKFLTLPDGIFNVLESDQWRTDLYLFQKDALRLGGEMDTLLTQITENQQTLLTTELAQGSQDLVTANDRTRIGGLVALILGVTMAWFFTTSILRPVRRLTQVAEQIESGNLDARAEVESQDEIGTLAVTFNSMTAQIQQNLVQIRQEKKRADDLLNVVIPIGVSLTEERDFNRLLENMLSQAKTFCNARVGILQLRTDDNQLKYAIVRDDAEEYVMGGTSGREVTYPPLALYDQNGDPRTDLIGPNAALNGVSVNIPTTHSPGDFLLTGPEELSVMHDTGQISFLAIPLRNSANKILGILELLDAQDPTTGRNIPFDTNLQQMMESFSSLAVAALEAYIREQALRQQIQQLHIEIDEAKRQKQVREIVETDFFQDLQAKARNVRSRNRPPATETPAENAPEKSEDQS